MPYIYNNTVRIHWYLMHKQSLELYFSSSFLSLIVVKRLCVVNLPASCVVCLSVVLCSELTDVMDGRVALFPVVRSKPADVMGGRVDLLFAVL